MNWYRLADPNCEFCEFKGKMYGRINGHTYCLNGDDFVSVKKNGTYFPDEVSSFAKTQMKMMPHHLRYVKGRIGAMSALED